MQVAFSGYLHLTQVATKACTRTTTCFVVVGPLGRLRQALHEMQSATACIYKLSLIKPAMYMSSGDPLQGYIECCYTKRNVFLVVHFPDCSESICHGLVQPPVDLFFLPPVNDYLCEAPKESSCLMYHTIQMSVRQRNVTRAFPGIVRRKQWATRMQSTNVETLNTSQLSM